MILEPTYWDSRAKVAGVCSPISRVVAWPRHRDVVREAVCGPAETGAPSDL